MTITALAGDSPSRRERRPARVTSAAEAFEAEGREVGCPSCGAEAGSGCVTRTGNPASFPHTPRLTAARRRKAAAKAEACLSGLELAVTDIITGASGGELGVRRDIPRVLLDRVPDLLRQVLTTGRHNRAGHDRARWETVDWRDYEARIGVGQRRGPWTVLLSHADAGGIDEWVCSAEGMPFRPGWYTSLLHDDRGLVMSDSPAEIAGSLPFMDHAAAGAGTALIAGLGLGVVPAWLIRRTSVARIDIVEIDPDVVSLSFAGSVRSQGWTADPRVHVHIGDAHAWEPGQRPGCRLHPRCAPPPARWDCAWLDIWDTVSPRNLPSMDRLEQQLGARTSWIRSWERPECEAMLARGQTFPMPVWPFSSTTGEGCGPEDRRG